MGDSIEFPSYLYMIFLGCLLSGAGYLLGKQSRSEGTTLLCGNSITYVEKARHIDDDWILFNVVGDQPRVTSAKKCKVLP